MFQGYYSLTSAMLSQTRNLNVIANNMSNVSTPGYKSDKLILKSFEEEMMYHSQDKPMTNATPIGSLGRGVGIDRNYTAFDQGGFNLTTRSLDFALESNGFFVVESGEEQVYTRNGSFSLDDEGYLVLQGVGRVIGEDGTINLGTDKISVDSQGRIYNDDTNEYMGKLSVVDFQNYDEQLTKTHTGTYVADGEATAVNTAVLQGALETANVESVKEMADMMASQRALQSSAQIMSIYDQLMSKIVQLGPA